MHPARHNEGAGEARANLRPDVTGDVSVRQTVPRGVLPRGEGRSRFARACTREGAGRSGAPYSTSWRGRASGSTRSAGGAESDARRCTGGNGSSRRRRVGRLRLRRSGLFQSPWSRARKQLRWRAAWCSRSPASACTPNERGLRNHAGCLVSWVCNRNHPGGELLLSVLSPRP
jgi:hypothetical protein